MQDVRVAAGIFECDNAIGMSVRRVDVVACVNCGNRKVIWDVTMMAGTDEMKGSLLKSQIVQMMVPAETTDRHR